MSEGGGSGAQRLGLTVGWAPGGWIYAAPGGGGLQRLEGDAPSLPGFGPPEGPPQARRRAAPGLRGRPLGALLSAGPLSPGDALALGAALCASPDAPPPGCPDDRCVVIDEDGSVMLTFAEVGARPAAPEAALRWAVGLALHLLGGPSARPPPGADAEAAWQRAQVAALWAALPDAALYQALAAAIGPVGAQRPTASALSAMMLSAAAQLGGSTLGARAAAAPAGACAGPDEGALLAGVEGLEGPTRFVPNMPEAPAPLGAAEVGPVPAGPPVGWIAAAAALVGAALVVGAGALGWAVLGDRLAAQGGAPPVAAPAPRADPAQLAEDGPSGEAAAALAADPEAADPAALAEPTLADDPPSDVVPDDDDAPVAEAVAERSPAPRGRSGQRGRRGATPAAAADPEPEPAPDPDPAPTPRPASATGRVLLTGDPAKVRLVAAGASHPPGVVPAGSYELRVSFGGAAPVSSGRVEVRAGQTVTLSCRAGLQRCTAR